MKTSTEENITSYKLKNGKILTVEETEGEGMAGEPATYIFLKVDGQLVSFEDVKTKMKCNDADELGNYIEDVSEENYNSAISFVI